MMNDVIHNILYKASEVDVFDMKLDAVDDSQALRMMMYLSHSYCHLLCTIMALFTFGLGAGGAN